MQPSLSNVAGLVVLAALAAMLPGAKCGVASPPFVRVWEGPAPASQGEGPEHVPGFYVFAAEKPNGAGVVIFPGGGYHVLAIDHEGVQVAKRLNRAGITAFVVKYRLKRDGYSEFDAFVDAEQVLRVLRVNAQKYDLDPDRLGVLGFSAGGHLASSLGVNFKLGRNHAKDPTLRVSTRPSFVAVCYSTPAPQDRRDGREYGQHEVSAETPPMFLWVTHQDGDRPLDNAAFYQSLQEAGVDAELHIFGGWGPHGLGLAPAESAVGSWPELFESWLRRKGLLTPATRVEVRGKVTIDGAPLHRGWISFEPLDDPGAPTAVAYITHNDNGTYLIEKEYGPVVGRHRVRVIRVAKDFLDTPSMDDAEVFPADGHETLVELHPGTNEIAVDYVAD